MGVDTASDVLRKNPITGIVGRCACADTGHAAAPPTSPMTPRLLKPRMESPLLPTGRAIGLMAR
jgi:hypothetical protein